MLHIESLTKSFGSRPVLRGVTLALEAGGVGVLIGSSGSGKSTVLRCVNGLEHFEGGTVTVGDIAHRADESERARRQALAAIRSRVGMVFQQFNLFPHLSVLGNVIEAPMHVLGKPRDAAVTEARALLERVGLGDRLDSPVLQLSGGQQQRVAIARALAMRPELILFDEPTGPPTPCSSWPEGRSWNREPRRKCSTTRVTRRRVSCCGRSSWREVADSVPAGCSIRTTSDLARHGRDLGPQLVYGIRPPADVKNVLADLTIDRIIGTQKAEAFRPQNSRAVRVSLRPLDQ
jgi:ABC-type polar amino acid transport system ATPase subunit